MRYLEIDVARGIAVLLMIAYHFFFDILYLEGSGFFWLAAPIASSFILISGVALSISYSKGGSFLKFAKRGFKLLLLGMLITVITFALLKEGFIVFGVLHFFGLTSLLIYPFLKYVKNNFLYLLLGALIIVAGIPISNLIIGNNYFTWLGLKTSDFHSLDYFPLIPWFGVLFLGVFLGKRFYPNGKRSFKSLAFKGNAAKFLSFFGRNSLIIYFIHQPILILILFLTGNAQLLSLLNI
ncbi:MAG TPA: heparan-alpha-glucosaminide N-acetyltransferase [archaeon]|nr:heparan-alpha-glucosaminide N-acetyltransferase [archaeon]